jgi:hypothetical protein
MGRDSIPDDVARFILTSITSVPYLEAMLLLRNAPDVIWDAKKVAQRLYMSEKASSQLLGELHAADVVALVVLAEQDAQAFRYSPGSEEMRQLIDRLADAYARHLVPVSNLIHSKISKKAQQFADAFKLRKE